MQTQPGVSSLPHSPAQEAEEKVGMGWGVAASFLSLHLWEGRPRPKGCVRPPLSPGPLGTLGFFFVLLSSLGSGEAPLAPPGTVATHTLLPPVPPGFVHFCFPQILIKTLCVQSFTLIT